MKRTALVLISIVVLGVLALAQAKPADLAYNNGYQAGYKLGQSDKKAGEKQDYMQASAFRRATDGWKEGVGGDLEAYRASYRNGFADGYRDGLGEPIKPKPSAEPPPLPDERRIESRPSDYRPEPRQAEPRPVEPPVAPPA